MVWFLKTKSSACHAELRVFRMQLTKGHSQLHALAAVLYYTSQIGFQQVNKRSDGQMSSAS